MKRSFQYLKNIAEVTVRDDGLTILTVTVPEQYAAIRVSCRAGAIEDEVPGTAHFLEHLIMRTGSTMPVIEDLTAHHGLQMNATTSLFGSFYEMNILPDAARQAALLLLGNFFSPSLREKDIEAERRAILQEAHQSQTQGFARWRHTFESFEHGVPACGSPEEVARIDLAALQEFHTRFFHPGNTAIIVVSPFEHEEVLGWFDGFVTPAVGEVLPVRAVYEHVRPPDGDVYKGSDVNSSIIFAFPGPKTIRDTVLLRCARLLLTSGGNALLQNRLREDVGGVYGCSMSYLHGVHTFLEIQVPCQPDKHAEILHEVPALLLRVTEAGGIPDQLWRSLHSRTRLEEALQVPMSPPVLADDLATEWYTGFVDIPPLPPIETIYLSDVQDAIRRLFVEAPMIHYRTIDTSS